MLKTTQKDEGLADSAVESALSLGLLSEIDLLRLKAIARLHARGLPGGFGWSDLLHEAIVRVLQGSRRKPEGISMTVFLAGVMRSIKAEHWRRHRREAQAFGPSPDVPGGTGIRAGEHCDPAPDPERSLAARQELAAIDRLFADDPAALQLLAGLGEGLPAEDIREVYGMSKTDYDSTRKRIRRTFLRLGLAWSPS